MCRASLVAVSASVCTLVVFSSATVYDAQEVLANRGLSKATVAQRTRAVEEIAGRMMAGDALALPRTGRLGVLDFSALPDSTQIEFGEAECVYLGSGTKKGLSFVGVDARITCEDPRLELARGSAVRIGTLKGVTMDGGAAGNANYVDATLTDLSSLRVDNAQFENTRVYYIRYLNGGGNPILIRNAGDCKGSRIYHTVEHNYCSSTPSVTFEGSQNLFAGVGDTEGSTSMAGCWVVKDCRNVVVFAHRMFHSHDTRCGTKCGISYMVTGGSENKFYYVQCIGNPCADIPSSLVIGNSPAFQLWGGSYEDKCRVQDDSFLLFYTPQIMTSEFNKWTEPAQVDSEVVLASGAYRIAGNDTDVLPPDSTVTFPVPPSMPSMDIGGMPKPRLPKASASWGSGLLAAGADPTGRRSSSEAFEQLVASQSVVEVPRGTFLLSRPLVVRGDSPLEKLIGAGAENTILKAAGSFPILEFAGFASPTPGLGLPKRGGIQVDGQTFDGGTVGIDVTGYGSSLSPGQKVTNCTFRNQSRAGIRGANGIEFDQVRVFNSTFTNTGDYGILLENCMVDKQGYFKCVFRGQKVAGVDAGRSHMFAGTIVQCRFEDITGPGVNMGYCPEGGAAGYTPHQSMICQSEFVNCGTPTRPSIEWSWNESSALIDVKVRVTSKTVLHGIAGTGQIMDRCSVFVEGTGAIEGAAFGVRHTRMAKNSRPTGNVLRDCYSNKGDLIFLADIPDAVNLMPTATGFNHSGLKWWQADDPSTIYPWAYPHLIYNCTFGANPKIDYVLLRTNRQGVVIQQVPLVAGSGEVNAGGATVSPARRRQAARWTLYDLRGRVVARNMRGGPTGSAFSRLSGSAYVVREHGVGRVVRKVVR